MFPRSGVGSLGKNRLAVYDGDEAVNVGCFVDRIRLRGINPYYVWAFLKTRFGWGQVKRIINGVAMPNISFDEIRGLQIPRAGAAVESEAEARWRSQVRPAHVARNGAEAAARTWVAWLEDELTADPADKVE